MCNLSDNPTAGHPKFPECHADRDDSHPLAVLEILLAHADRRTGVVQSTTAELVFTLTCTPWERRAAYATLLATGHLVRLPTGDLRVFRGSLFTGRTT